jgi:uncharacterized protein (TIGR02246 family)
MRFLLSALLLLQASAITDSRQELTQLEQELTQALVRDDAKTIADLWADDLVWVGTNGKTSSKAERLSAMRASTVSTASTTTIATAKNQQVEVRVYGEMAVVTVVSTWTTRTNDREANSDYMATHVWRKEGGKWRLVSAHISRVIS